MAHASFVHLRVHSAYSLSEGAIRIGGLVELCRRHAMPAVAITDTGNLFGALELAMAAAAAGVQPIIGCQLAIRRDTHLPGSAGAAIAGAGSQLVEPDQLVVLAQNETGYGNLLRLTSKAYLESDPADGPQLALADVVARSDGLIALTGGSAGAVGRLLGDGQAEAAARALADLRDGFGDRLYVELQRHGLAVEQLIEPALVELAYSHAVPLVATNEPFFADADMFEAHDALLCIAASTYVAVADRRRVTVEHRFKSAEEMAALFEDLPEAVANTVVIAQRCGHMPVARSPILPPFKTASGRGEVDELRTQAEAGLAAHLALIQPAGDNNAGDDAAAATKRYKDRLNYELEVIEEVGFAGYFLIVADIIQWARRHGIPVGVRGSGAASMVGWSLTISDLDPLRHGLLFERFLNPERVSMPDFDMDFCQERRDEVIRYVQDKYGHDRVAQIITFGKLQARAVLKDVGRVLGLPYSRADRISKLVPYNPANPVTLAQAIEREPQLQQMRDEDAAIGQLVDIALKLEGLYRNSSTHAAGVVIGDRPLVELIPLYRDPRSDVLVTQFNMKYVEQAGLVKFDFLGLKTLTVIAKTIEILATRGTAIDIDTLPLDDPATFAVLARADTMGVFQCESTGMRDVLRKLKPDRFEDIVAVVALYRPGPMDNIPSYIKRKHGAETIEDWHPSLEPVLRETYGIPIYQEQVMEMARALSGYTLGGADLLRRAMGKKIRSEMAAQRRAFIDGAVARGVDDATAENIFVQIEKFAGYGFNKSHAAAYALVAYRTAYLKANHPIEFLAASMTYEAGNTDRLALFRRELDRLRVTLLAPDVNRSAADFAVEDLPGDGTAEAAPAQDGTAATTALTTARGIRYALAAIKGVGRAAMEVLVAERTANGPFADLFDFVERLDSQVLNKRQLEQLVAAGALDALNPNRTEVFHGIDTLLAHAQAVQAERASGQSSLFGGTAGGEPRPRLPAVDPWEPAERLQRELEAVGFYLSAHPLDDYVPTLDRLGVVSSAVLASTVAAQGGLATVKLAGVIVGKQERTSQRGSRYAFVQLSDVAGVLEVTLFSEVLATARELLDGDKPLLVRANARLEDDQLRLTAQAVEPLAGAATSVGLKIWLREPSTVAALRDLVDGAFANGHGNGNGAHGRIQLVVAQAAQEIEIGLAGAYRCTPQLRAAIRAVPGVIEVREV